MQFRKLPPSEADEGLAMLGVFGLAGGHVDGVEVVLHGHADLGAHIVVQLSVETYLWLRVTRDWRCLECLVLLVRMLMALKWFCTAMPA